MIKAKFKELENCLNEKEFNGDFWFFLFQECTIEEVVDFLFSETIRKTSVLSEVIEVQALENNYDDAESLIFSTRLSNAIIKSEILTKENKEEIITCYKSYFIRNRNSILYASDFFENLLEKLAMNSVVTDTLLNENFLKGHWSLLLENSTLTKEQYETILDFKIKNNNDLPLYEIDSELFQLAKPETFTLNKDLNWPVIKTCFDYEKDSTFKALMENVDEQTFKILEANWTGTLNDLIEVCIFNGPNA